jgi:hypothetical protein
MANCDSRAPGRPSLDEISDGDSLFAPWGGNLCDVIYWYQAVRRVKPLKDRADIQRVVDKHFELSLWTLRDKIDRVVRIDGNTARC